MCCINRPFPYHITDACVRTNCPNLFYLAHCLFYPSSERCLISTQNCCCMDLWSVWLVLTHHHPSSTSTPPTQEPYKRETKLTLFLELSLACLNLPGCLELLSNSHSKVLSWCRPWPWHMHIHMHQPPAWLSREPSDLSGLEPASLFLS